MKGERHFMRQQRFKRLVEKYFAMPQEMIVNLPKVTIIGQTSCHIENHQGIVSFSDSQLILKAKTGFIIIVGSSLTITMMLREELFLKGHVKHVEFSNNL